MDTTPIEENIFSFPGRLPEMVALQFPTLGIWVLHNGATMIEKTKTDNAEDGPFSEIITVRE